MGLKSDPSAGRGVHVADVEIHPTIPVGISPGELIVIFNPHPATSITPAGVFFILVVLEVIF